MSAESATGVPSGSGAGESAATVASGSSVTALKVAFSYLQVEARIPSKLSLTINSTTNHKYDSTVIVFFPAYDCHQSAPYSEGSRIHDILLPRCILQCNLQQTVGMAKLKSILRDFESGFLEGFTGSERFAAFREHESRVHEKLRDTTPQLHLDKSVLVVNHSFVELLQSRTTAADCLEWFLAMSQDAGESFPDLLGIWDHHVAKALTTSSNCATIPFFFVQSHLRDAPDPETVKNGHHVLINFIAALLLHGVGSAFPAPVEIRSRVEEASERAAQEDETEHRIFIPDKKRRRDSNSSESGDDSSDGIGTNAKDDEKSKEKMRQAPAAKVRQRKKGGK